MLREKMVLIVVIFLLFYTALVSVEAKCPPMSHNSSVRCVHVSPTKKSTNQFVRAISYCITAGGAFSVGSIATPTSAPQTGFISTDHVTGQPFSVAASTRFEAMRFYALVPTAFVANPFPSGITIFIYDGTGTAPLFTLFAGNIQTANLGGITAGFNVFEVAFSFAPTIVIPAGSFIMGLSWPTSGLPPAFNSEVLWMLSDVDVGLFKYNDAPAAINSPLTLTGPGSVYFEVCSNAVNPIFVTE